MNARRIGFVAASIMAALTLVACDSSSTPRLPHDPLVIRPTITDTSRYLFDTRSIARRGSDGVMFVDPATGDATDTVPPPPGPPGQADTDVAAWFIVDTADDTYVGFVLEVSYPQDGLIPPSTEMWIYTVSRRTGATVYERRIEPSGTFDPAESYLDDDVVVDRAGTAVFTVDGDLGQGILAVPFLPGRTAWYRDADGSNGGWQALAVANGVVLVSKATSDEGLYGVEAATGTTLWHLPVDDVRSHPDCVVVHGDHFVVLSDTFGDFPLTVTIRDGAVSAAQTVDDGCAVDPAGNTIVSTGAPMIAYNLPDGRELWSLPIDQVRGLGLKVVGIYGGLLYVKTDTERLVLDARTGQEVGTDWVAFPLEVHDGWILAHHISYSGPVIYPGTELPAPKTTTA